MTDLIVVAAFISFLVFIAVSRYRAYAAVAGWCCIVFNLWSELPALLQENNFVYPVIALLALPFLYITAENLLNDNPVVLRLSKAAAIATVIYVPFALVPALRDGLISLVVSLVFFIITALGNHPELYTWDVIAENGFYNQIILSCTGIMAIALVLGIVFSVKDLTPGQAVRAFAIAVPAIFFLNLLRVAYIFIAVSDKWFAGFPDPTGTGDANFFWAHNVVTEGLAIVFLIGLFILLVRCIPLLGTSARALMEIYFGRFRKQSPSHRDDP